MRRSRWRTLPGRVEQVHDQLESWRRTRKKRSPIPERIWGEAARLARECGLSVVSKALRLNYADLKRHAQAAAPPAGLAEKISLPTFVELEYGPVLAPAPCVVEMETGGGVRMRISLRELDGADLAALVAAFGSRPG